MVDKIGIEAVTPCNLTRQKSVGAMLQRGSIFTSR
jgi:hypothetical protein